MSTRLYAIYTRSLHDALPISGTMTGAGTTRLVPGATMNVSGSSVKDMSGGRIMQNDGTWNLAGTGDMRSGVSTFNNTGVFDVQTDVNFQNNLGGTAQLNNTGTLKKTGRSEERRVGTARDYGVTL